MNLDYSETEQAEIGEKIADILGMKVSRKTLRYETAWGSKSAIGLYKTIVRIAEDLERGKLNF